MATEWSLERLMNDLHLTIARDLQAARELMGHPVDKGDASEQIWLELLTRYLPKRYQALKATVVDSEGKFSQQIDIVICDRQYTPFIFTFKDTKIVPAESVYAVFECKQDISAAQIEYAKEKVSSVRQLTRTSLPIPHAGGTFPAKIPGRILGGLLCFESDWSPPMGETMVGTLADDSLNRLLDIGCVAAHGTFTRSEDSSFTVSIETKPATAFLFELIALLQAQATVAMIDIRAYAQWLSPDVNSRTFNGEAD